MLKWWKKLDLDYKQNIGTLVFGLLLWFTLFITNDKPQEFLTENDSNVQSILAEKALHKIESISYDDLSDSIPKGEVVLGKDEYRWYGKFDVGDESFDNGVKSRRITLSVYRDPGFGIGPLNEKTFSVIKIKEST